MRKTARSVLFRASSRKLHIDLHARVFEERRAIEVDKS